MLKSLVILGLLGSAVAVPSPGRNQRIVGGSEVTRDRYPSIAALLFGFQTFEQWCGSTILNTRSVLTAPFCFTSAAIPAHYRVRVGSTFANSGGVVHAATQIFIHPNYDFSDVHLKYNIAIIRLATVISFNTYTQPAAIAGSNYNLADNQAVWAAGWAYSQLQGPPEPLRHVQAFVVNHAICTAHYGNSRVTDSMLCSEVLHVEGRDQCLEQPGSPLYHNNVLVGVYSHGSECATARYSISTRVSSFTPWIQANA